MMSDIQETLEYDKRTLDSINKLIDKVKPDLVVLGGDNCDGTILKTEEEMKKYLDIFSFKVSQFIALSLSGVVVITLLK